MVAKRHQNPKGGLNEAGRKFFERKQGGDLKPPVKPAFSQGWLVILAQSATPKADLPDYYYLLEHGAHHLKQMLEAKRPQ
jgi:hypothetical protein